MSTTYQIVISEQQRAILLAALASTIEDQTAATHDGTPEDEAKVLRELLDILPHEEAESVTVYGAAPGRTLHSFVL